MTNQDRIRTDLQDGYGIEDIAVRHDLPLPYVRFIACLLDDQHSISTLPMNLPHQRKETSHA